MNEELPVSDLAGGMRLAKWAKQVGLSRSTVWRLQKAGKLQTVTRYGMVFITAAEMRRWFKENPADGSKVPLPA